jgi:UDP-N-acetylglucosamine 2-epimerase (non-hydrolysing)/GDP/UDP-N,N'-diacetylbacillosamine 2-epimerase (hydrolysing)
VSTVDIGDRQRGRRAADSVFHAEPTADAIAAAIGRALARGRRDTVNPYGDGRSSARILEVLAALPERAELLRKPFHLLEPAA